MMNAGSALSSPAVRILLADANPDTRALIAQSFIGSGFDVVQAADGRDALTKAFVHPPALVVTSLDLPFIDGFALCEILRKDHATTRVPILVVAEPRYAGVLPRIQRAGADDVLIGPVVPDALVTRSRDLIAASAAPRGERGPDGPGAGLVSAARRAVAERPKSSLVKAHQRELTDTPRLKPPTLNCPSCSRHLTYEVSYIGGVSERHPEQWDFFSCSQCGVFQYRQRTRKVRRLNETELQWLNNQRSP